MPSVRGTIHDVVNKVSYTVELEGPRATLVHVWSDSNYFQPQNLVITKVPLVMSRDHITPQEMNTGDIKDCNKGVYVLGELTLEDMKVPTVAKFYDSQKMIHFVKQAFISPYPNQEQIVESYSSIGIKTLIPRHPKARRDVEASFPIVLTLVGSITHLPTPLPRPTSSQGDSSPGPSGSRARSDSSMSEVFSGHTNLGPHMALPLLSRAPGNRETPNPWIKGQVFTPLAASTSSSPNRDRPGSSQSLPDEDNLEISLSPQRPRSASPRRGRAGSRRSERIQRSQLSIQDFFLPSPVKKKMERPHQRPAKRGRSPTKRGRAQGTSPSKRTASLPPTPTTSPPPKRRNSTRQGESSSNMDETIPRGTVQIVNPESNLLTPADSNSQSSSLGDTSNEAGSKEMQSKSTTPPSEEALPKPPLRFLTDRREVVTSRSTSTVAHQGSNNVSKTSADSFEGTFSAQVELHSDIPLGGDPRHVLMRTERKGVKLEVIAFEPFNLRSVMREFFEGREDQDFAEAVNTTKDSDDSLIEIDNSVVEEVVHLDNSLISPDSSLVATSAIQRFPAATLEVITLEPSEALQDFSDLALSEPTMAEAIGNDEEETPEERGEKEKRRR